MSGFHAYQTYLAVKNHFKTDYDFFKYNGKISTNKDAFDRRRDKFFFEKIEKKHKKDLIPFLVSNLIIDQNSWAGSLVSDQAEMIFTKWKKRFESLKYEFRKELGVIRDYLDNNNRQFDDLFECNEYEHPIIFQMLLSESISLETFIIMNRILKFSRRFDKIMLDDPLWLEYTTKIKKYNSFFNLDDKEYKKILRDVFL